MAIAQQEGYTLGDIVPFVDKKGNSHSLEQDPDTGKWNIYSGQSVQEVDNYKGDLSDLRLEHNDVSKEDYDKFKQTGEASFSTLKKIAKKIADGKPLSIKEQEIANQNADELSKFNNKSEVVAKSETTESISTTVEGIEPEVNDAAIEAVNKKKGINLYPSTGRNLLNEKVKIGDDLFAEKINPSPSQQLWFETLDKEVSENPTAYTVQVFRLDDKSNKELHDQIKRDSDPVNSQDGDLYVVLHKDGKPVLKGSDSSASRSSIESRRQGDLSSHQLKSIVKIDTYEGLNDGNELTQVQIRTDGAGNQHIAIKTDNTINGNERWVLIGSSYKEGVSVKNVLAGLLYENIKLIASETPANSGAAKINAKYDAELANAGKPVIKNGSSISAEDIENKRTALISKKATAKEKFEFLESLPVGTIFKSDEDTRVIIKPKKVLKSGTEEFELATEVLNEENGQWEVADVKVISKKHTGEYTGELPTSLLDGARTDLNTGDRLIVKPKITIPSSKGNYVFTGLYRPDTLYPLTKTGTPARFVLAERIILENYLLHLGTPKLNIDSLSKADKDKLKLQGIDKPTRDNIMSAAFIHSRSEYSKWYDNLQEAAFQKQTERQQSLQAIKEIPISPSIELVEKLSLDASKEMFEKGKENNWTLEEVLERISLSKTQRQLVLEQNANLVKESAGEVKPELKLEFVSVKDLVDSDNPVESREAHNKLKQRYDKILDLLNCI